MYVIDPHPLIDISPYRGTNWQFNYSKYRQATSLEQRATYATSVSTEGAFDEVLVDWLQPENATGNNPTWCSYGPNPNGAWLIAANGSVTLAQLWFEEQSMQTAMEGAVAARAAARAAV